jgi:hypothetical protein
MRNVLMAIAGRIPAFTRMLSWRLSGLIYR